MKDSTRSSLNTIVISFCAVRINSGYNSTMHYTPIFIDMTSVWLDNSTNTIQYTLQFGYTCGTVVYTSLIICKEMYIYLEVLRFQICL